MILVKPDRGMLGNKEPYFYYKRMTSEFYESYWLSSFRTIINPLVAGTVLGPLGEPDGAAAAVIPNDFVRTQRPALL